MKLATYRNGTRDGALVVVSRDLTKAVPPKTAIAGLRDAAAAARRLGDYGLAVERIYAELNEVAGGRRPAPFDVVRLRRGTLRRTLAARLSMGRRLGLRQPRRAGAARARRRDAGELLDRAADVPGRLGRLPRARASRSSWPTRPGASTSRARSPSSPTTCRWARRPRRRRQHIRLLMLVNDVSLRNLIPARARQGLRLLPRQAVDGLLAGRRHARRAGRRLARTASCTCRCWHPSTASRFGRPNAGIDMTFSFRRS